MLGATLPTCKPKAGKGDDAQQTAARIQSARARVETWATLAKELHARKQADAKRCFANALEAMQNIADGPEKMFPESSILEAMASLGEIQDALRSAKSSQNELALHGIARVQAAAGEFDGAYRTARQIATETTRDYTLEEMAEFVSFDQAQKLIDDAKYDLVKTGIWIKAARGCLKKGDRNNASKALQQARILVNQIIDPPNVRNARLSTLVKLTETMAGAGFMDDAFALADAQTEPAFRCGAVLGILTGMPDQ
jgi:hypothetical protein